MRALVNKRKAIELKQLGWSYEDIAHEIGCSVPWCAKYLKGIKKDVDKMRQAYEEYKKAELSFDTTGGCEDDLFSKR